MKEKIIEALKTRFKNLGFGEKAFDGVASFLEKTITDDTQIETGIAGVEPLLKGFQSDIDKRVTEAVAKAKAEATKPEPPATPEKPATQGDDVPAWAKGILDRLDSYERREKQSELNSRLRAKLSEKKVPEWYLKGRTLKVESEAEIDNVATQIESDFAEARQMMVNDGVIINTPADSQGDKSDVAVARMIAEKRNNPAKTEGVEAKKLI